MAYFFSVSLEEWVKLINHENSGSEKKITKSVWIKSHIDSTFKE